MGRQADLTRMEENRKRMIERLQVDLIGPYEPEETISSNPTDTYLTGILFPAGRVSAEEDEKLDSNMGKPTDSDSEDAVSLVNQSRPSSMGLSFAIESSDADWAICIQVSGARYKLVTEGQIVDEQEEPKKPDSSAKKRVPWRREEFSIDLENVDPRAQSVISLEEYGQQGLMLHFRVARWDGNWLITVALSNDANSGLGNRNEWEQACVFQSQVMITSSLKGTRFISRPTSSTSADEDSKVGNLIYRSARQYASGHTCSATWSISDDGEVDSLRTDWLVTSLVPAMDANGHRLIGHSITKSENGLVARSLGTSDKERLFESLESLVNGYLDWVKHTSGRIPALEDQYREQAKAHMNRCEAAAARMTAAMDRLRSDSDAFAAFQMANLAMAIQWDWLGREGDLTWRPFQLGFMLLSLESIADDQSDDRETADLLWFPTGGGKTEAYLALVAFTIFYRRLKYGQQGAGVAALMRYTLRLLTTQQFERASGVICACEAIRTNTVHMPDLLRKYASRLGPTRISIGLWVGGGSTPNTHKAARAALRDEVEATPRQITKCPRHRDSGVTWVPANSPERIVCKCRNPECEWSTDDNPLPVWTVDTDVYRERPSLLIGTVDKFAQIVRNPDTRSLLASDGINRPADLIIQDELHLISGPLGTLVGVYESAIDLIISRSGFKPKILASTATIRRADEQIRALFDRRTELFPAPGIDSDDSGFAVVDRGAPGRLYAGISTVGRSAKFALQAAAASSLQSSGAIVESSDKDAYWTLIAYFNSLRELGGALVLFQDDVNSSIREYARQHEEHPRLCENVKEITSRVTSSELRQLLDDLEIKAGEKNAIDAALATNMISVGMDVPRLGLMLVNGQPKTMSEYIQATSRVGRGEVAGFILTVYNSAKPRDRSHFENFRAWHEALYREVEASSVTPFAPRARDRALHAAVVAVARHLVSGHADNPRLTEVAAEELRQLLEGMIERTRRIDESESKAFEQELDKFVDEWSSRPALRAYWDDRQRNTSLLISAEAAAEISAAGRVLGDAVPTPNSMRTVEPAVGFKMSERMRD